MRVADLANDLGVSSQVLLNLLRTLRISASNEDVSVSEGDVALVLARLERERRSGHEDAATAIEAAIVDAKPTAGKRRRRRKSELPPEPDPEAPEEVDAAEEAEESEEAELAASGADTDEGSAEVVDPVRDPETEDVGDGISAEPDIVADSESAPADPEEPALEVEPQAQAEEGAEADAEADAAEDAAEDAPVAESPEPAPEAPPRKPLEPARKAAPATSGS